MFNRNKIAFQYIILFTPEVNMNYLCVYEHIFHHAF